MSLELVFLASKKFIPCQPSDLSIVKPGTLCWFDADRFGLNSACIFIEQVDEDSVKLAPVSVCYDEENDTFLTSQKTPPLPTDACNCYMGQGYSACSCNSAAIAADNGKSILKWFRENQTTTMDNVYVQKNLMRMMPHMWLTCEPRDECKKIFSPTSFDFASLNNSYSEDSEEEE